MIAVDIPKPAKDTIGEADMISVHNPTVLAPTALRRYA
jgi:hypothetical protein